MPNFRDFRTSVYKPMANVMVTMSTSYVKQGALNNPNPNPLKTWTNIGSNLIFLWISLVYN